jgi:hypothetical protein
MTLKQLGDGYYLCDGEIFSINVNWVYTSDDGVNYSNAAVNLKIRKKIDKKHYESCIIRLTFKELEEIDLLEDSKRGRDFSDIVLKELPTGKYYLSLDPYGNSGEPNDEDNLVIIAKYLEIDEQK